MQLAGCDDVARGLAHWWFVHDGRVHCVWQRIRWRNWAVVTGRHSIVNHSNRHLHIGILRRQLVCLAGGDGGRPAGVWHSQELHAVEFYWDAEQHCG